MSNGRAARLIGLFVLGLLLFNFPFLGLFGVEDRLFHLPGLLWYIFLCWLLLILGTAILADPRGSSARDRTTKRDR